MRAQIGPRRVAISAVWLFLLTGLAWDASAGTIELDNDVGVVWQNDPNCVLAPALCKPLVIGAPRLVPDMSNAGNLLQFIIDFHAMSVDTSTQFLGLNIADANANEVFRSDRPGEDIPLQLTYPIPLSARNPDGTGFLPATDIAVNLERFNDFGLLPPGDLLFTVTFRPQLALPFNRVFGFTNRDGSRTEAVTLTITGPGTVTVPEPATLVLLLSALTSVGLSAGWRRIRRRASRPIG